MTAQIKALLTAIEYPEEVLEEGGVAVLRVDGEAVRAQMVGKRLVVSQIIDRAEEDVPELAALATGRLLREEAVLASRAAMLENPAWETDVRQLFETLMALSRGEQQRIMDRQEADGHA